MLIEIYPEDSVKLVRHVRSTNKNFFYQKAYAHKQGTKFPVEIQISLEESQSPYTPGRYQISDESYKVNNFGRLELDPFRLSLIPVAAPVAAPVSSPAAKV